jgi:hypothetical protein
MPRFDPSETGEYQFPFHAIVMPHMRSADDNLTPTIIPPPQRSSSPHDQFQSEDMSPSHSMYANKQGEGFGLDNEASQHGSVEQDREGTNSLDLDDFLDQEKYDSDIENRRRSKYDVKPPPNKATPGAVMPVQTRSASKLVDTPPRRRSGTLSADSPGSPLSHRASIRLQENHDKVSRELRKLQTDMNDMPMTKDKSDEESEGESEDNSDLDNVDHRAQRNLRERSVRQTNPYKFDKHTHKSQKSGKNTSVARIAKEVKREVQQIQRLPKKKQRTTPAKSKTAAGGNQTSNTPRSSSVLSINSSIDEQQTSDPAKVTLRVRLDGFNAAATRTTLEKCDDIEKLITFIHDSWEWQFSGGEFSHAVVSFPWLSDASNILLRHSFHDSFQGMVDEINKSGSGQVQYEIDVTAFLRARMSQG